MLRWEGNLNRVVWDTEAKNSKFDTEDWTDYRERAGIGLACVYDLNTKQYEFYDSSNIEDLASRVEKADEVISYNGVQYDHCVLDAVLGRRVFIRREVDLWVVLKACMNHSWERGDWKLGAVCERTIGFTKNGNGAHAPELLGKGKIGDLTTYLINDVWLTAKLYEFITTYGYVVQPDDTILHVGRRIEVLSDA